MEIDSLTVGQVKEIANLAGCLSRPETRKVQQASEKEQVKIVVLQRGWVVVGKTSMIGDFVCVKNAKVIRNWGTTKGLGEIAGGGPTKDTRLDACEDLEAHILTVVLQMKCAQEAWSKHVD